MPVLDNPVLDNEVQEIPLNSSQMLKTANLTTAFLKSLAHSGRLMILCRLVEKPSSVGELEKFLELPQSEVSKQLSRLRKENLVKYRREGRSIIYSISDVKARIIIDTLYDIFCREPSQKD